MTDAPQQAPTPDGGPLFAVLGAGSWGTALAMQLMRAGSGVVLSATAFDRYDDAIGEGRTAFLLDRERPDIFTASVGNLMPGKTAEVEISYVTELARDGDASPTARPLLMERGPQYGRCPSNLPPLRVTSQEVARTGRGHLE